MRDCCRERKRSGEEGKEEEGVRNGWEENQIKRDRVSDCSMEDRNKDRERGREGGREGDKLTGKYRKRLASEGMARGC